MNPANADIPNDYNRLREESAYSLASRADVASPDSLTSPGAAFLYGVRDGLLVTLEYEDTLDIDDEVDAAVPVSTHEQYRVLVDLCAYQVLDNLREDGTIPDSLPINDQVAATLASVARDLCHALLALIDYDGEY
jgi:hypothetical protein